MFFAQLQTVEPGAIKDFILIAGGFITIAGGIVMLLRKNKVEPQPLRVQAEPQLVTQQQCEQNHFAVAARFAQHDHQIELLWTTMREENIAIRSELARGFKETASSLGQIVGELRRINTVNVHERTP